jgi:phosphoenolpyruvate synthase/pyruvate phosphate dikinase
MQKILSSLEAGGKGFNLQVLKLHGFKVPDFAIFTHEDIQKYESRLQDWPHFNECLSWGPVAVRSSGSLEDGTLSSFAGLFKTKLNVQSVQSLKDAIVEVWISQNSDVVNNYIQKNNIPAENFRFSIVIQRMINPDYAGVSFSANPVNGVRSQCLISFTDGLGEKLVSGDETGSSYVLNLNNEVLNHQGNLTLDSSILKSISDETRRAAEIFKTPVDIEWAVLNGQLFILQARPITSSLGHTATEHLTVFDNSNIQESYNGVTTPLTYSYAVEAYHQVYNQIMKLMKMSDEEFEQAQYRHRHMLGLIEGRVYYNINSWYEGLLCLPHFGRQKEAMEKMMGLQKPVDFVQDVTLSKSEKLIRLPSLILLMLRLMFQFSRIDRHVDRFAKWFDQLEIKFNPSKNQFLDNHELIRRLYDFQRQTLEKWGVPILNDFLVMMTHGSLKKQAELAGLDAEFHEALQGSDVESVKPSEDLMEIASLMRKSNFWSKISNTKDTTYIDLVLISDFPEVHSRIQKHLHRFGDRSFAELKLETITYRQDRTPLFNLLYELCKVEEKKTAHISDSEIEKRFIEGFKKHFGFLKSLTIRRRLKKLKKAIAARELMRLHRTRVFGMNREYYLEIGRRLAHLKQIHEYRDIFYLTRQEIFDYFWGHSVLNDLKGLVSLRKESWKKFQDRQLDQQVVANIPNGYWSQMIKDKNLVHDLNLAELKGLGCSNGIVRAIVKKVENPYDVSDLQNKILLAERTDPGWTPLFSMIKGAIIERGSALSHSAVIAREMGLPVVVGVDNVTELIFDGDEVEIDGQAGTIKILSRGKNGALTT